MISIIDYGMGNLRSVSKGFAKVGVEAEITRDPAKIRAAKGVVLPGVGAFGRCMENIEKYGLVEVIKERVASGAPFMGICLGLQLLFEESEEFGPVKGLGALPGRVVRFPDSIDMAIPQMGWNTIKIVGDTPIFEGIPDGSYVYFVHSFYVVPTDKNIAATVTEYGVPFVSAIAKGNLFASQFHPEKSGKIGLSMLKNFGKLVEKAR